MSGACSVPSCGHNTFDAGARRKLTTTTTYGCRHLRHAGLKRLQGRVLKDFQCSTWAAFASPPTLHPSHVKGTYSRKATHLWHVRLQRLQGRV